MGAVFEQQATDLDVVLLDLTMPPPSGTAVLRHLRSVRADLPVILMSGFTTDSAVVNTLDAHTRFIRKPFLAAEVLAVIESVLGDRPPRVSR